jgi:putative ABC transport system permease protein
MNGVTQAIAKAYPKSNQGWGSYVDPLQNDFMPKERNPFRPVEKGAKV